MGKFLASQNSVAIIGSGPAGLMAAEVVSAQGYEVHLFEKRSGLGRKILVAGSSGLNVTFDAPLEDFVKNYSGPEDRWREVLHAFTPQHWLQYIESLGLETFLGTSRRYFVKGLKGTPLLYAWMDRLKERGVQVHTNHECLEFDLVDKQVQLEFGTRQLGERRKFSAVCFCLGGGSWEKVPPVWPKLFQSKGIGFTEFASANSGFQVQWSEGFLKEAEGLPLKSIVFENRKGSRAGELMVTGYGLEGTPVYALGESGPAWIDLKPALTHAEIMKKLLSIRENLSPMRRVKRELGLSPAALALVFHFTPKEIQVDLSGLVARIKRFPLMLQERQPLSEAISSSGGIHWAELNEALMLHQFPGVFAAGEMIDWHAPTGGFLIQGSVSLGFVAGQGILNFMQKLTRAG